MSEYWQHEETGMVCKSATRPSKRYYNITSSILTEEIMRLTAECETLRHELEQVKYDRDVKHDMAAEQLAAADVEIEKWRTKYETLAEKVQKLADYLADKGLMDKEGNWI